MPAIILGSPTILDGALDLRGEDEVMSIERAIETRDESESLILLPAPSRILDFGSAAEIVHLEMMLICRSAVVHPHGDGTGMEGLLRSAVAVPYTHPYRSLLGSRTPTALMLGDIHNPNVVEEQRYDAAFGPHGGCGPWLWSTLPIDIWRTIAVANAGEEDLQSLVSYLGEPPVVALGRRAQTWCAEAGIDCGVVPHPQYSRRFFHSRAPKYGQLMLEVARTGADRGSWPRDA